jgi:hypothetical protein
MLLLRRMVAEEEGVYRANPGAQALLAFYANAIEPLLVMAGVPAADGAPRGAK